MVSMTKDQMVKYLDMYARICNLAFRCENANTSIYVQFVNEYGNNIQEFNNMLNTVKTYYSIKLFSFCEDFLLNRDDFIDNDDLDEMNGLYKISGMQIENKRALQLMRNAFNHNNQGKNSSYKLSINGRKCEVSYDDIRYRFQKEQNLPIQPITIRVDNDDLYKITNIMTANEKNLLYISFEIQDDFDITASNLYRELDKIKFLHYYFPDDLPSDVLNFFKRSAIAHKHSTDEIKWYSKTLKELALKHGYVKEYAINDYLKRKLVNDIKGQIQIFDDYQYGKIPFLSHILVSAFPIPLFKIDDIKRQLVIINYMKINPLITPTEISIMFYEFANECRHTSGFTDAYNAYKRTYDGNFTQAFPLIMYIDAYFTNIYNRNTIEINGKLCDARRIRNSFSHGRWVINDKNEIILYDAEPENEKDMELTQILCVSLEQFYNDILDINVDTGKRKSFKRCI